MYHYLLVTVIHLCCIFHTTDAFFRMPCGTIVTERIDPIISPGKVSAHVHQVAGGNGLGFSQNYAITRSATCTTAAFKEDLSNYWTPVLYYQHKDGSFTRVSQSGMTVYYLQRGPNLKVLKAFPAGLRMVAGNPFKRNFTGDNAAQAVSFVCLDYSKKGKAYGQYNNLPTHACPDGIRAQVFFPSCWDGKNLDSPDHTSHLSYPIGAYNDGMCPPTHPVQFISIFFEVIFGGAGFQWWNGNHGTKQPFVFAHGDATGYGFHGDFINGWDVNLLQKVVNKCTNLSGSIQDCAKVVPELTIQSGQDMDDCVIPVSIKEEVDGPLPKLPGCNPVTGGPALAKLATNCPVTKIAGPQNPFTDILSQGWAYLGCASDVVSQRSLTGYTNIYMTDQETMTVYKCAATCGSYNYKYAGLEYGGQCFCGNSFPSSRMPSSTILGSCNMVCRGDSSQWCGGPNAINLYQSCTGSSCRNYGYNAVGRIGSIQPTSTTTTTRKGVLATKHVKTTIKKKVSTTRLNTTPKTSNKSSTTAKTSSHTIVKPETATAKSSSFIKSANTRVISSVPIYTVNPFPPISSSTSTTSIVEYQNQVPLPSPYTG